MSEFYSNMGKRFFDLAVVFLLFPVVFPLICVLWVVCFMVHGRPVFFVQERAGIQGRVFRLIKFRSLKEDTVVSNSGDRDRQLLPLGRFLRRTSLDEIPEFWNIFLGDMSLVGPRPLLPAYTKRYNIWQRRRLDVKPGLTGLAQVSGRNTLSWLETFRRDLEYVEKLSFSMDLIILVRTLVQVFRGAGSGSDESSWRGEFTGDS